jgi:ankyrin repeat protein
MADNKAATANVKPDNRKKLLTLLALLGIPAAVVALDIGGVRSTPLSRAWHYAFKNDHPRLAEVCLRLGARPPINVNAALRRAVADNTPARAAMLLAAKADPNVIIKSGLPALYWCALRDYPQIAALLVRHGADTGFRTRKGWTPLAVAVKRHHNGVVRVLIDAGADTGIDPQFIKKSPLWLAAGYGNMKMLEWFLEKGADTNVTIPSAVAGRRPHSLLDFALRHDQVETARRLIRETGPSRMADENVVAQPFISNGCLVGIQRALSRRKHAGVERSNPNPIVAALEQDGRVGRA